MENSKKIVLITGASSGFGRLTAEDLNKAGHEVYATMRNLHGLAGTAQQLSNQGIKVVELDVTDNSSVNSAVTKILEQTKGRLDVVINNAGRASVGISEAFSDEQVRAVFDVNVFGVQRVMKATLPTLIKQKSGLVVNIGSVLGRITVPFMGLYGASKFAIEAMTDSYRYELSQLGVDVVLIQPSAHPTNLFSVAQTGLDAKVAAAYGDLASIPGAILQAFSDSFVSSAPPRPQDVAEAIRELIETRPGKRPDRVVIGAPYGSDAANNAMAPIQRGVLEAIGLQHLDQLKQ